MHLVNKIEWAGSIFGIIGALFVALNLGIAFIGYCFFFLGAVCYIIVAVVKQNAPLLWLNLAFAITNIIGLGRH